MHCIVLYCTTLQHSNPQRCTTPYCITQHYIQCTEIHRTTLHYAPRQTQHYRHPSTPTVCPMEDNIGPIPQQSASYPTALRHLTARSHRIVEGAQKISSDSTRHRRLKGRYSTKQCHHIAPDSTRDHNAPDKHTYYAPNRYTRLENLTWSHSVF